MALISTEYVATAMRTTFDSADLALAAQLIDEVSDYIEDYTGKDFSNVNMFPDGIPHTIRGVAARAVIRGMTSEPSNLTTLTVGDITEVFGTLLDFSAADQKILDMAGGGYGTIYLASRGGYPYGGDCC